MLIKTSMPRSWDDTYIYVPEGRKLKPQVVARSSKANFDSFWESLLDRWEGLGILITGLTSIIPFIASVICTLSLLDSDTQDVVAVVAAILFTVSLMWPSYAWVRSSGARLRRDQARRRVDAATIATLSKSTSYGPGTKNTPSFVMLINACKQHKIDLVRLLEPTGKTRRRYIYDDKGLKIQSIVDDYLQNEAVQVISDSLASTTGHDWGSENALKTYAANTAADIKAILDIWGGPQRTDDEREGALALSTRLRKQAQLEAATRSLSTYNEIYTDLRARS